MTSSGKPHVSRQRRVYSSPCGKQHVCGRPEYGNHFTPLRAWGRCRPDDRKYSGTAQDWQSQCIYRQRSISHRDLKLLLLVDRCGVPWLRHRTCSVFVFPFWRARTRDHCEDVFNTKVLPVISATSTAWLPPTGQRSRWQKAYEGEYPQAFSNPSIGPMLPGSFLARSILQVSREEKLP